jgi:hypothetical protein
VKSNLLNLIKFEVDQAWSTYCRTGHKIQKSHFMSGFFVSERNP